MRIMSMGSHAADSVVTPPSSASPTPAYHPPVEDRELLEKFGHADTRQYAFNLLVRKYQQRVYGHIRKMVIDHDDADDLTQEVFVRVWQNLDNFRQQSQLFTWIYRIATNECLNFLQKKRRRFFLPIHDLGHELAEKLESSPDFSGDAIEFMLQKALLTLPDKQRLVFHLRYYDEMEYKEMSEVLGTSTGALKASYHIAAKKVEAYLLRDGIQWQMPPESSSSPTP